MTSELKEQIKNVVIDLFLGGNREIPLDPELDIVQAGICDSLGLVRLATTLESTFPGLKVQDQDVTRENLGSVRAIASFVHASGAAS